MRKAPEYLYADISEKAFTAQVIALLRWYKWRCAHFRPGMTQRGRWVTAVSGDGVGFPDIFALRHNRRLMAELKTSKGKTTPEQETWLAWARSADIEAYIWRPQNIDEIEAILKWAFIVDPHDYWLVIELEIPNPPKELDPYQKLFMAILMDAVETLKKPPKAIVNRYVGRRQYKVKEPGPLDPIGEAHDWLMSDDDATLGFVSICEYLGWSPTLIRKRALKAIETARANPKAPRRNNVTTDGKRRRKWG